jgi:hypothetical protein
MNLQPYAQRGQFKEQKNGGKTQKKRLTLSSLKRSLAPFSSFKKKKNKAGAPLPFEKKETRDLIFHMLSPLPLINTNLFPLLESAPSLVHPLLSLSAIRQPPHTPFSCHSPISWLHKTFPPSAINLTSPYLSVT